MQRATSNCYGGSPFLINRRRNYVTYIWQQWTELLLSVTTALVLVEQKTIVAILFLASHSHSFAVTLSLVVVFWIYVLIVIPAQCPPAIFPIRSSHAFVTSQVHFLSFLLALFPLLISTLLYRNIWQAQSSSVFPITV